MKAFHYQHPHPMQPQPAAVIMCVWQERSPWDCPASETEHLHSSEGVLAPGWAQNMSRYSKRRESRTLGCSSGTQRGFSPPWRAEVVAARPSVQSAEAPLCCTWSWQVDFFPLNLILKICIISLPNSVVFSLHDRRESWLDGANSKQELDHEGCRC